MNKGPDLIKMFSQGEYRCELTKDELLSHCFSMDDDCLKKNWETACGYFSGFTDDHEVCMVNLDDLIDGNILDRQKRITATMIITALNQFPSRFRSLPRHILINCFSYLHAVIFELNHAIFREKAETMLIEFECDAYIEMKATMSGERSFDDVLDSIFDNMPSIEFFSEVKEEDKGEHIEFFEHLLNFTKYSSTSYYENTIEEYLNALKK